MRRRAVLLALLQMFMLLAVATLATQRAAHATHVVTIVVQSSIGSRTDYATRVLAKDIERYLAQRVIVINIAGTAGIERVARAPADGTTLLVYLSSRPISVQQFAPVAVFAKGRGLLAPRNTPPGVIARLERATQRVTMEAAFNASLERRGVQACFVDSQQFFSRIATC